MNLLLNSHPRLAPIRNLIEEQVNTSGQRNWLKGILK